MKQKVTMQDIADEIGVSKVTVSRAFNNKSDISDTLKEKILKKANELGYRYNSAGNTLRSNQSYSIGVISSKRFFGEEDAYYAKMLSEITVIIDKHEYTSLFQIISLEDERQNVLPRMYCEQKIDGLIILGQLDSNYLEIITDIEIPVIFLDFYNVKFDVDSINVDNVYAVNKITNLLVKLGHEKIAFVGSLSGPSSIHDRYLGYLKTLIENNLVQRADYIIEDRDKDGSIIPLELPEDMPTAFVCNNDKSAYHLIEKVKSLGYDVPNDISVVGFDNTVHSKMSNPKISTIQIDTNEMVELAVKFLIKKIKNPNKKYGRVFIDGNIIERESIAPVKKV